MDMLSHAKGQKISSSAWTIALIMEKVVEMQLATLWTGDLEGSFPQKVKSFKNIQEDPQTY